MKHDQQGISFFFSFIKFVYLFYIHVLRAKKIKTLPSFHHRMSEDNVKAEGFLFEFAGHLNSQKWRQIGPDKLCLCFSFPRVSKGVPYEAHLCLMYSLFVFNCRRKSGNKKPPTLKLLCLQTTLPLQERSWYRCTNVCIKQWITPIT